MSYQIFKDIKEKKKEVEKRISKIIYEFEMDNGIGVSEIGRVEHDEYDEYENHATVKLTIKNPLSDG